MNTHEHCCERCTDIYRCASQDYLYGGCCHTCSSCLTKLDKQDVFGTKHDAGKPRWSLLPTGTVAAIVRVLEHGALKYGVGNWKLVPEARTRYYDAAQRHLQAWWEGERFDPESKEPHLAHAACCLLFLMWFDFREESET